MVLETETETAGAAGKKISGKKVTIRSFMDDDSIEVERGVSVEMDGETDELPWDGFEEDERLEGEEWSGAVH